MEKYTITKKVNGRLQTVAGFYQNFSEALFLLRKEYANGNPVLINDFGGLHAFVTKEHSDFVRRDEKKARNEILEIHLEDHKPESYAEFVSVQDGACSCEDCVERKGISKCRNTKCPKSSMALTSGEAIERMDARYEGTLNQTGPMEGGMEIPSFLLRSRKFRTAK